MKIIYYALVKRDIYKRYLSLRKYKLNRELAILDVQQLLKSIESTQRILTNPNVRFSPVYNLDIRLMENMQQEEKRVKLLVTTFKLTDDDFLSVNKKELLKQAEKKYPKGTQFKSPAFPTWTFVSTGEISASGFREDADHFINMWVEDGIQPQGSVPVYLKGQWAEIVYVGIPYEIVTKK